MPKSHVAKLVLALVLLALPLLGQTPEPAPPDADELLSAAAQKIFRRDAAGDEAIEQALALYRSQGDPTGEALCLVVRGLVGVGEGTQQRAIEDLDAGRRELVAASEPLAAAVVAWMQGSFERLEGRSERAQLHLRGAEEVLDGIASTGRAASVDGLLRLTKLFGAPSAALEGSGQMLRLLAPMLAQAILAIVRGELAMALLDLGRVEEAEVELELAQATSGGAAGLLGFSLDTAWGELRRQQWRLEEAKQHFIKSLEAVGLFRLFPFTIDRRIEISVLGKLAQIDTLAGRYDEALAWNDRALAFAREDGDGAREASVLEDRGAVLVERGDLGAAEGTLRKALALAEGAEVPRRIATIESSLGSIAFARGMYGEAAVRLERSVALLHDLNEPLLESASGSLLAEVYLTLDSEAGTDSVLQRARVAAQESEWGPVQSLLDMITAVQALKDSEVSGGGSGAELRGRVPDLLHRIPELGRIAGPLIALLGPAPGAAEVSDEKAGEKPEGLGATQSTLLQFLTSLAEGRRAAERGDPEVARKAWAETLAAARSLDNGDLEALTLAAIAGLEYRDGKPESAIAGLREALDVMESSAGELHAPPLLASYLGGGRGVLYEAMIEVLQSVGRSEEAFAYSERARARAFLQQLGDARIGVAGRPESGLVDQADALRRAISGWERDLPFAPEGAHARIRRDIAQAQAKLEGLMTRIQATSPEYASLVRAEPLDLAAVQGSLDPDQTLVSYFVTSRHVHAWVVSRGSFASVSVPLDEEGLKDILCWPADNGRSTGRLDRGVELLVGCAGDGGRPVRLFRLLFAPVKAEILGHRVIAVPHGPLHYLPLAALRDPDTSRFLIEDYSLSYLPSASVLPFLRGKDSPFLGRALVLGAPAAADPDLVELPGAADEARQVAASWATRPWLGPEATESRLRAEAPRVDLIHLAAHGILNSSSPSFSHIALAPDVLQDGNLEVHELLGAVDLTGVNLVVLSACDTALGKRSRGDEVASLARAVLYAGSPAVVSTLWTIDDEASAELMAAFYRHLQSGQAAADALRQAQLDLLRGGRFAAPSYWAGFTITGDFRPRRPTEPAASPEAASQPTASPEVPALPERGSAVARSALLVGIGEYPPESGWPRSSAASDVELLRSVLERYSFAPGAVAELHDREATREGIERAVTHSLLAGARPGGVALFFYAGHGRQMTDQEPADEVDGYDEALVPYDAPYAVRQPADLDRYLRDDVLGELFVGVRRRLGPEGQLVVLLDTCHSGTLTRGDAAARGAPPLGAPRPRAAALLLERGAGFVDEVRGSAAGEPDLAPMVVLSASRAGERAIEVPRPGGGTAGSLTWALGEALSRPPTPRTYRELLQQVRARMAGRVPNLAQGEGALDAALFLGPALEQMPYFPVFPRRGDGGRVELHPGTLAGLQVGAEIALHAGGTTAPAPSTLLAEGRVVAATPYAAVAELRSPVDPVRLAQARAFVTSWAYGDLKLRLAAPAPDRDRSAGLPELLSAEGVEMASDGAEIALGACGPPRQPGTCQEIVDLASGELLRTVEAPSPVELARELSQWLRRLGVNRYLRRLDLYAGSVHTELEVVPLEVRHCRDPERPSRRSCEVLAPTNAGDEGGGELELPIGSFFELRVRPRGGSAFLNVLDLMPDGEISVIWPPAGARELMRPGGESVRVLDEMYRVTGPLGTDVILLVASAEPIDMSPLRRLDVGELDRGELGGLGPFSSLLAPGLTSRGEAPTLPAVEISTSRRVVRIVPAHQAPRALSSEERVLSPGPTGQEEP